ncbi:hypothetical protein LOTGIDRAFT_160943 [Lottia gigantea]|uniref:Uncharacterized protein n=1 Tax=Lottia gigantea TaxID=225164 RepID=V4AHN0_LOTGI|nr:hypothetical protein LOTGIDRAFT_160943 [Lottia gigantea]ESO94710.1 hypothetical protein LOTGIDRAFT_160943 [Lottia gigantea]
METDDSDIENGNQDTNSKLENNDSIPDKDNSLLEENKSKYEDISENIENSQSGDQEKEINENMTNKKKDKRPCGKNEDQVQDTSSSNDTENLTRDRNEKDDKPTEKGDQSTEKDDKPTEKGDQSTEKNDKPTEKDDKPTEKDDKPTDKDDKPTEKNDKPTEKDDKPTEKDVKPTEKDVKPTEKDDKPTEKGDKPTEEGGRKKQKEGKKKKGKNNQGGASTSQVPTKKQPDSRKVKVNFHVLLPKEFHMDVKTDQLFIRGDDAVLGGWSSTKHKMDKIQ